MKGTAVQAFSKLAAKIHPVSLTKKESSRLLTALTSSFEKHLDAAHPIPHRHGQQANSQPDRGTSISGSQAPASLTEKFFASVLTNPIMATRVEASISDELSRTKASREHPMSLFDRYAAAGSATLTVALLCLEAHKGLLNKETDNGKHDRLRQTPAGYNVLRWLWSSQYNDAEIFTRDKRLVNLIVEFLVAEGREEMAWKWYDRSEARVLVHDQYMSPKAQLLRSLVRTHLLSKTDSGLELALQSFLRASDGYKSTDSPGLPKHRLLSGAGLQLTRFLQTTSLTAQSRPTLLLLYDRLLQSSGSWSGPSGRPITLDVMILKLRHPVLPDASDALALVRNLSQNPGHDLFSPESRRKLLQVLFETVEVLQTKNLVDDAAWVMEFTRENFEEELEDPKKQIANQGVNNADVETAFSTKDAILKTVHAENFRTGHATNTLSWRLIPG